MFDELDYRQNALGYGRLITNWPWPDKDIDSDDRAYVWGNYRYSTLPNPRYIPNHVERTNELLIEQFRWRGL